MYKTFGAIMVLCFVFSNLFSQPTGQYPVISGNDFPEAKFSPVRTYNGESLFGYIDGGADLYLEYGFSGVTVEEFVMLKGKYKTEIYKMTSPEAAFGIFSVSRFRCRNRPDFSSYTCQNKYQLQICAGQYYISIVNESGSSADSSASIMIGKRIVEKISQPSMDLTTFLPGIPLETLKNETYLVKGRLGVINGMPDLEDYLKGLHNCTAVILKTPGKILLSLRFENSEALEAFGVSHNWNMNKLSGSLINIAGGESVRKLSDNHVFIEISAIGH